MKNLNFHLDNQNSSVTLTTYVIDDSKEMLAGKKRPAILICPGGAYLNCSDRESEPIALRFAAMGYHAFVLHYHVFFDNEDGFEKLLSGEKFTPNFKTQHPAPILDIAHAMTIIYDHADEWLVDTDKIALCGFSAGGHNVLNYAVHFDQTIISDHYSVNKIKPSAVIVGYPITDYFYMKDTMGHQDQLAQNLFALSNLSLLGTETPSDSQLLAVSVINHVKASTPPMFIWSTSEDALVPVGHSTRLATALADAGVPFELHIFEEGPHGLSLANQATAKTKMEINVIAAGWINSAESWLNKRFSFDLPDKSPWHD